jgi:pyruvate,water dikinase
MANLAREFDVPAIVGMAGATATLEAGDIVTVDAGLRKVFPGPAPAGTIPPRVRRPLADTPAVGALREIAAFVTPLKLTDSTAPGFAPESCRSLHDVTRFVHEKAYEVMFHYGDLAVDDREASRHLEASLPIAVRVFDVGGGIAADAAGTESVSPEQITSVPMNAFLSGMLEKRIRWDQPRPVSVRGFLSVLGESISGPPAEARQIGRQSYAIVSDRYMNFSTKAGYHFSTVDTYCGQSQNKNYVHFRFSGGAADPERRERRIRFLKTVLTALDFKVQARGDFLTARLDKYGPETIQARLVDLGHLTLCARQLDMLMGSDASPDFFARAFLAGEWEKF